MALYEEPRNAKLHQLVRDAVRACNEVVNKLEAEGRYIGTHFDFPTKVRTDNHGWPSVSAPFSGGPTNYGNVFGPKAGDFTPVAYDEVPELSACIDYIVSDDALRYRANLGPDPASGNMAWAKIGAAFLVTEILDRARHELGAAVDGEVIDRLYLDIEPRWVLDELPIEIVVPVVLTKFEVEDRVQISDGLCLERMDGGTHRARAYTKHLYTDANPFLLEAATHALVLEGYSMPAVAPDEHRLSFWPVERIDNVFRALEIVEDLATGYGQITYRPLGWVPGWKVDLPPLVKATTTRKYPPPFDSGGWNTQGSVYPADKLAQVGETFTALENADRSVGLAARRLGSASLRSRTDDNVIDLCIGLEALFGERGAEVTHKLATRLTTVLCMAGGIGIPAEDVFRAVKQVYDYRSRVVHGEDEAGPRRSFTDTEGREHDVVVLARRFLRVAIGAMLKRQDLLKAGEVDRLMLASVEMRFAQGVDPA